MTKSQLIKALEPFDDNLEVWIKVPLDDEFSHQPMSTAKVVKLDMIDGSGGETLATYDVIEVGE